MTEYLATTLARFRRIILSNNKQTGDLAQIARNRCPTMPQDRFEGVGWYLDATEDSAQQRQSTRGRFFFAPRGGALLEGAGAGANGSAGPSVRRIRSRCNRMALEIIWLAVKPCRLPRSISERQCLIVRPVARM